ncbi:flagellum-specific ATP synthase [Arboricoccus pini]|uniref:Flagellum-specific ATP synthase n=1 Tax=Arboricoccus pini TaxID=1963835 RepID=A0A212RBU1_9PROT|nr:FliI/YscN family ATPase [Arboricoccus pini]SNB69548.1 flagellum-specific ATP synthase [Arboricoccus pini]
MTNASPTFAGLDVPRALQAIDAELCPWRENALDHLRHAALVRRGGRVTRCSSSLVTCAGLDDVASIGSMCWIEPEYLPGRPFDRARAMLGEVVALHPEGALVLPYAEPRGIMLGARVAIDERQHCVLPDASWRGRVLDPLARPLDEKGPLRNGPRPYPLHAPAIPAHERSGTGSKLHLGVRAMDLFTPCCEGQRLGIFAGTGVGKSSLMSMIARASEADIMVIGLIGERGRELHDFLSKTLGPEGLARSIVVVATSDMPPMMRRRAAYLTLTIAEACRDSGLKALCLLDSVTRFAMALREIYLAAGEPPTTRGYPPGVFAELPRLLERAGPGRPDSGSITGLFTVMVEGDDMNEPVSDAVRGILDGHVILDRKIAERGRFPAIDVLRSLSRTAPDCYAPQERESVQHARQLLACHAEMAELIQLGAYKTGANPLLDEAIARMPRLEALMRQSADEPPTAGNAFDLLAACLASEPAGMSAGG